MSKGSWDFAQWFRSKNEAIEFAHSKRAQHRMAYVRKWRLSEEARKQYGISKSRSLGWMVRWTSIP